jgi:hypothetical protein
MHSRPESRCTQRNFGQDIQLNGDLKVVSPLTKNNHEDLDIIDYISTSSDVSDIFDLTSSMNIDSPLGMKGIKSLQ